MDAPSEDWRMALREIAGAPRVLVIGATDVGKTSFVREVLANNGDRMLVDLDPGQKMIGAPGTLGLGRLDSGGRAALAQFFFIGSTSPVPINSFLAAARALLDGTRDALIANTSGLVEGAGVRLQRMTIDIIRPELIVAIARGAELDHILADLRGPAILRTPPPPAARRKAPGERRRARQQAFAAALNGATRWTLPADVPFIPAVPVTFAGAVRPVCAITDATGAHVGIGLVEARDAAGVSIVAAGPPPPRARIVLGRMWARQADGSWCLLGRLRPSWEGRLREWEGSGIASLDA